MDNVFTALLTRRFVLPASGRSVTALTLIAIAASVPAILAVAVAWALARR